ncbi:muellerian-inhibiting factor [Lampris incognitus]|uniref:muellerian-inhibiting factor n=1 Tax=Lampris incognitus TaxID=2546036 RepID=UPI0024B5B841|nr:muellerian-inhibiting factor [Lampris incognitus]
MPVLCVSFCAVLMMSWTVARVAPQQVIERDSLHGLQMQVAATETGGKTKSKRMTNYRRGEVADDIFAVLHEGWGKERELTNKDLTRFGVCINSDGPRGTVLTELVNAANREHGNELDVLYPTKELLEEEEDGGRLVLTLTLPQSPLLRLKPILLLSFRSAPAAAGDLAITFTSQSLNPNAQTVCISEQTRYVALTGKASADNAHQSWKLFVEKKDPNTGQILQEILGRGGPGSNITMTPFLLFMLDLESDVRNTQATCSFLGPSDTISFLCELQKFLSEVRPQSHPGFAPVQLGSLQSLPSLALGLSSSETLLAELLNSSAPTLFFFPPKGPVLQVHSGELALPPVLVEVLRQRLEQAMEQLADAMLEVEVAPVAIERLGRLKALSAFPKDKPVTGQIQYRAFLLMKALQTVTRIYEAERVQRATRADQNGTAKHNLCQLHSLSVPMKNYLMAPTIANINNCWGICGTLVTIENSHAFILSKLKTGPAAERSLCCVPIAYEDLQVVEVRSSSETYLKIQINMVAKECQCR